MTDIISIFLLVFIISAIIVPLFYEDKVNSYILKNKGKLIKTEFRNEHNSRRNEINKEVIITYKDEYNNLREVSLHYIGFFSFFGKDKVVKYSSTFLQYDKQEIEQINFETATVNFKEVDYKLKSKETLTIKQEYTNPNIGEFVFINNKPAPNGNYKISWFTSIHVINGRIVDIK